MQNFKLFHILSQFDKLEQNRIRKFINSPYFNRDKVVCNLFELMIEEVNSLSITDWTKETIWNALVPEISFDDARLRKYQSDLLKLVEQYLIQQEFEVDVYSNQTYLLKAIKKKKLNKLQNSVTKSIKEVTKKQIHRDGNFFLGQFLVETAYEEFFSDLDDNKTDKRNHETTSFLLDCFYIGEKLKLYCEVLTRSKFAKHDYQISFIDQTINFAEIEQYQNIPFIAIYYSIYKMYVEPNNVNHYFTLIELLNKSSTLFPIDQERSFYYHAQNYCTNQLNQGNNKFLSELFNIYKQIINRGFFKTEGYIDTSLFRNTVTVGLRLGEYYWVEDFIIKLHHHLPSELKENIYSYSLSQLYLYQKKYDKVIELLRSVDYNDYTYNINAKTFLLMTYYEIEELEPLSSLLESMRVYLNRNKQIPESRKTNFKNLIRFTKKLISITPGDKKGLLTIQNEVKSTKNIASRDWLLEKITELE